MKVWILLALVSHGHLSWSVVPTLEFSTEEKCIAAGVKMRQFYDGQRVGTFKGNCISIEK